MDFRFNAEKMNTVFMVPGDIADKHLKLAGAMQLRVILYCFKNMSQPIDPEKMAEFFGTSVEDVTDALMFWAELGFLITDRPSKKQAENQRREKAAPVKTPKPTRTEIVKRGFECPQIAFLLNEAQLKFSRTLKESEKAVLVWMYDDLGLDASLILMVIEYAMQAGKCNVNYIEKIAKDWADSGVETIADAEQKILELTNSRSAWNVMRQAFGLDMRAPSDAESKLANSCILEWKMSSELLKKAYDICIDSIGKYKASYIKTVVTAWHKQGIKTLDDLKNSLETGNKDTAKQGKKSGDWAAYDIDLMNEIINGD